MLENSNTGNAETNLSKAVVEDNFESFADQSNQREIAEKLGKPAPKAAAAEVKAEPEVVEVVKPEVVKHKSPGQQSYKELRNEVRELRAKLESRLEAKEVPEVKEEPKAVAEPEKLRARPKPEDLVDGQPKYKSWIEYEDDLLSWNEEKLIRTIDERTTKRTQEAQITEINKSIEQSWKDRITKASEAHEDFEDALHSEIVQKIQPGSLVDEWILDSEQGAELLYYFHHNPEELKKFEDVKGPTPGARRANIRRMLTKIEDKILAASEAEEKPEPAAEKEEAPVRTTKTLPPSREVGGRGAAPTDRIRAAVANDDTGSYIEEMNRREIRERFGDRR